MLTGSNDRHLTYKGINDQFIYFYQRWQELLDHRTVDMYRYNILNSNVACLELVDVIEKTISGLHTSRQNIDDAKAEALAILKQDDVLSKYNKPLHNTLLRIIGSKIESKSKNESSDDKSSGFYISINRLKFQLMTPSRILQENYLNYLLQEIKVDIEEGNIPQMERHMSLLVSQCINNGWSARGLFQLSKLFEGRGATLEEKWREFSHKLTAQQRGAFEVYFGINIETRRGIDPESVRSIIQSLGMMVQKGVKIINEDPDRSNLCNKLDSTKYYIVVFVNATDLHSATLSAINQLNKKLSVATFYNTVSPWIANSSQIVTLNFESL